MLAFAGGMLLALGAGWLLLEAALRHCVRHDVRIVNWTGRWPSTAGDQKQINDRLDRAQDRELNLFHKLRPVPVLAIAIGAILIAFASVG